MYVGLAHRGWANDGHAFLGGHFVQQLGLVFWDALSYDGDGPELKQRGKAQGGRKRETKQSQESKEISVGKQITVSVTKPHFSLSLSLFLSLSLSVSFSLSLSLSLPPSFSLSLSLSHSSPEDIAVFQRWHQRLIAARQS